MGTLKFKCSHCKKVFKHIEAKKDGEVLAGLCPACKQALGWSVQKIINEVNDEKRTR